MKSILEYNSMLKLDESLEKAKKALEKGLSSQGFEIYVDDSTTPKSVVISIDELIDNGAEYDEVQKVINTVAKKFKLKTDTKMSNDNVVFLNENISFNHEEAINAANKRLFTLALEYKEDSTLAVDEEFEVEVILLSEVPKELLEKFISHIDEELSESGETFSFSAEPLAYPNFQSIVTKTNVVAKSELMTWWSNQGLSPEQQELAQDNIMKVQHHIYTNFYLGNPGRAWLGTRPA